MQTRGVVTLVVVERYRAPMGAWDSGELGDG